MKVWKVHGIGDMRMEESEVPEAPPGHCLLRILAVQPSITECALFYGQDTTGSAGFTEQVAKEAPWQVFGHEFCGEIVSPTKNGDGLETGQRVANLGKFSCGTCVYCKSAEPHLCWKPRIFGLHCPGALAEYVVAPMEILAPLPAHMDTSEGCCIQPLTDAFACVEAAGLSGKEEIAVFGQGVMGLYCLQIARYLGVGKIYAIDVESCQLELASQLGADHVVNAQEMDPVQAIMDATGGRGVDVALEAAGGDPQAGLAGMKTFTQSIEVLRPGGTIVPVALWKDPIPVPSSLLRMNSVRLSFPLRPTPSTLRKSIELVAAGSVKVKPLISRVLKGIENVPRAFEITANKREHKAMNPAQVHFGQ